MALTKIDGSVLANTGVTSGNYGGSSTIPTLNIDAQGRIVSATNTTISVANTLITGLITSGQIATVANTQITGTLTSTQLSNTAVTAGTYGGSTQIPVVTIDQQGRITSASNTTVSTTINLSGTTGSGSVSGGGTLTFASNNGFVVSSTGASTLYLNSAQDIQTTASPSFNNLSVTGNLTVSGAYTYTNTAIFQTVDSLIELAANNTGDVVDIGFYGQYNTSSYAGLVRTGGSNFVLFKGLAAPSSNTFGVISLANTATLKANLTGGMITALANTIGISDGGTNNSTYTTGALVQYNGSGIVSLANTGTAGTYGNSSYHPVITTDVYGRVTSVTNTIVGLVTTASYQIGSLGVGTAASGTLGEIRAANNITAYYSSDSRLKENVVNIPDALAKVKSLNGVEFDWTDKYLEEHGGEDGYFLRKHDIGIIAQQLEQVLPEIVADRPDGYKAVKYERIVALLIEAIKELSEEVERLKESK